MLSHQKIFYKRDLTFIAFIVFIFQVLIFFFKKITFIEFMFEMDCPHCPMKCIKRCRLKCSKSFTQLLSWICNFLRSCPLKCLKSFTQLLKQLIGVKMENFNKDNLNFLKRYLIWNENFSPKQHLNWNGGRTY